MQPYKKWNLKLCEKKSLIQDSLELICDEFVISDAMRDLDAQGVLRQDFILVFGDCVGNVNLSEAFQEHKQRSKEDKNATMTLVYRKAMPGHHLRTIKNEVFLAVNDENR